MKCLTKCSDAVSLQVLSDALAAAGIGFRVEDAGMRALMPLPGVMDARVMVEAADMPAAMRVLRDLEMDGAEAAQGDGDA